LALFNLVAGVRLHKGIVASSLFDDDEDIVVVVVGLEARACLAEMKK